MLIAVTSTLTIEGLRVEVAGKEVLRGFDLEMHTGEVHVIMGPNGSGKSNLVEIFALLKASPTNLPGPMKEMGGVREWFWKGAEPPSEAIIEALIESPPNMPVGLRSRWGNFNFNAALNESPPNIAKPRVRHRLVVTQNGERFEMADEQI